MSDYGMFEAVSTDGFEEQQRVRTAQRSLDRAIFEANEKFGSFLGAAESKADFDNRLALVKRELIATILEAGVDPVTGVVRKVAKTMRPDFSRKASRRKTAGEQWVDTNNANAAADWATAQGYNDPWDFADWVMAQGAGGQRSYDELFADYLNGQRNASRKTAEESREEKAVDLVNEGDWEGYLKEVAPDAMESAEKNFEPGEKSKESGRKEAISDNTEWEEYDPSNPDDAGWAEMDEYLTRMQTDPAQGREDRAWDRQQTDTYNQNAYDEFRDVPVRAKREAAVTVTADDWKYDQAFQQFLLDLYGTTHGLTEDEIIEALEAYAGVGRQEQVIGTEPVAPAAPPAPAPMGLSADRKTAGYQSTNWRDYPDGQPDPSGWGGDVYADYEDAMYPNENPRAKVTGEESYGEFEYQLEVTDGSGQVVAEETYYDLAEAKAAADKQLQKLYKGEGKLDPDQGKFFTTPGKGKLF